VLYVALPPGLDPAAVAALIAVLRGALGHGEGAGAGEAAAAQGRVRSAAGPPARANVIALHAPPDVTTLVDLFGPVPSLGLMRVVKRQFDPAGTMAPGRFAGGI
jgi:glycolate oxidase FAD binding subunit